MSKSRKQLKGRLCVLFLAMLLGACSSIDCPLYHSVSTKYKISAGDTLLRGALSVITTISDGGDSVLLNQLAGVDSFSLPVSHTRESDRLLFLVLEDDNTAYIDTVIVDKDNIEHFESVDCNPAYFHVIRDVHYTRNAINSITIEHQEVSYDTQNTHLRVNFKSGL